MPVPLWSTQLALKFIAHTASRLLIRAIVTPYNGLYIFYDLMRRAIEAGYQAQSYFWRQFGFTSAGKTYYALLQQSCPGNDRYKRMMSNSESGGAKGLGLDRESQGQAQQNAWQQPGPAAFDFRSMLSICPLYCLAFFLKYVPIPVLSSKMLRVVGQAT